MKTPKVTRWAIFLVAGAIACTGAPEMPPGAISSEAAQALILQRDEARDSLAKRERELLADIEALKVELRTAQSSAPEEGAIETEAEPPAAATRPAQETALAVEMLNMSSLPIETNNSWTRFSWQGVVHNNLERQIDVKAIVLFLDAGGFELESVEQRLTLQPGEFRKISGVELINHQVAPRVATIGGRVEQ